VTTHRWSAQDLPDLSGRTVVVTGASSGIGAITAREMVRAGAHVVLAVRDIAKGERVARDFVGSYEVRRLDLSDLDSVREFARAWDGDIAILINNAGVMAIPQSKTKDGFEMQFGTNHLGHFALTNLLLPQVTDRVVTLSSPAHQLGKIDLRDLNWQTRPYRPWPAYCQSKLANLMFAYELQRRVDAAGSSLRSYACHPGYSATNLQSHTGSRLLGALMAFGNKVIAQSEEMGALPTLFAATQDLPGGRYVGPDGFQQMRGRPTVVGSTKASKDAVVAAKLWEKSEELTSVSFPLQGRSR
jgi:NAD(P)-dependent dehydrogenase (short-subunit alcohol dehydrogenase family)